MSARKDITDPFKDPALAYLAWHTGDKPKFVTNIHDQLQHGMVTFHLGAIEPKSHHAHELQAALEKVFTVSNIPVVAIQPQHSQVTVRFAEEAAPENIARIRDIVKQIEASAIEQVSRSQVRSL